MPTTRRDTTYPLLRQQASCLRQEYPELFAYLDRRDRALQRTIAHVPDAADVELSAAGGHWEHVSQRLRKLEPGIAEIAET